MRKSKKRYALWNGKELSWKMNPPKNLKKKMIFLCPHCEELYKKEKKNTYKDLKFRISFNLDSRTFKLSEWTCVNCASELDTNTFSKELKNFIKNLFLRYVELKYLQPAMMIVKIKGGKEVSGKALETGGSYKSIQKTIIFICGHCKNKNQFQIIGSKESKIYQCRKCGVFNSLPKELDFIENLQNK